MRSRTAGRPRFLAVGFGLLGLVTIALAQETLWVRRLDLGVDEYGYGIAARGNAIAVGGLAWGTLTTDWLVVRTNQAGDTAWTRTYDSGLEECAIGICLDAESSVLVAGYATGYLGAHRSPVWRLLDDKQAWRTLARDQQEHALTAKYDSSGGLKWLRTDTSHLALGIVADSAGNCFVSGAYYSGAGYDLWLAKFNPSGDTIWTRTLDLAPLEIGYRLALDARGNVAATAYVGDGGNFDCLTLKLTPDGDTVWTRRFDLGPDDGGCGLAIDPNGNIIVAGMTRTDTTSDVLVLKYHSTGVLLWSKVFDFDLDDGATGAGCDSAGDIYIAGCTGAHYVYDCLVMKLTPAGDVIWTATYGGSADDGAYDVACDSAGNPVIAGYATDSIAGSVDLLMAKYHAVGGIAESGRSNYGAVRTHSTITATPDIILSVPLSGDYDIRLCDLRGDVRQGIYRGHLSKGAHRFSLARQPAGLYFVRVAAPDGGISCHKLVLVK